jgi:hypothetical protein
MTPVFRGAEDVIATHFAEGGVVLVHLGQNRYFNLNNSAGVLWRALSPGASEGDGVAALRSRFNVGDARAAESCRRFVQYALALGILVKEP